MGTEEIRAEAIERLARFNFDRSTIPERYHGTRFAAWRTTAGPFREAFRILAEAHVDSIAEVWLPTAEHRALLAAIEGVR